MISSPPQSNPPPKKKLSGFTCALLIVILLGIGVLLAIWFFGSRNVHKEVRHPLYSSFDESPEHKKLLNQLVKSKKSILIGKKEDGVLQFAEHLANIVSRSNKAVFIEDYNKDHFQYFQIARQAKTQIDSLTGQTPPTGDWIIQSQNGHQIPLQIISDIQLNNPNGKILVVSSTPLKIKGFKQFTFPTVTEKILESTISKSFKVKPAVADILHEYLKTAEQIYENLDEQTFDSKAFLGSSHRSLDDLNQQQKEALQTLCKKGVVKSMQQNPKLTKLGVIHYDGSNYWRSNEAILNYELSTEVNCKNTLAPATVLKHQEEKEAKEEAAREAEEQRQQQEEQKRAQEKKKAQPAKTTAKPKVVKK